MFISNLLPLTVLLQLQAANNSDRKNVTISPFKEDYYPSCASASWNIKRIFVLEENSTSPAPNMEWYVNFYVGKKGTTTTAAPPVIIRVNQDETTDLPLCVNGAMVVFKMELVREPILLGERGGGGQRHRVRRHVRRETSLKQSWTQNEYYQVTNDGDGLELTVRVARNRLPKEKKVSNSTAPISSPSSATTTSTIIPTTKTARTTTARTLVKATTKKPTPLSDDCLQYKYMIEQMERWGREELKQIEYGPDSDAFCRNRLPASSTPTTPHPTTREP